MKRAVFVGGKDYDPQAVAAYLNGLPAGTLVVTGDGLGLERWVAEQAVDLGFSVFKPVLRPDLYDYTEQVVTEIKRPLLPPGWRGKWKPGAWLVTRENKTRKVNRAKDMQVVDMFVEALGNTIVLGNGTRAKFAREILKRTDAWPIQVVEL